MTALEALKAAREFVQELYAIKNDRGYPRFTGNVRDVLTEENADSTIPNGGKQCHRRYRKCGSFGLA
jgi:hypothetical protein